MKESQTLYLFDKNSCTLNAKYRYANVNTMGFCFFVYVHLTTDIP